MNTIKNKNVKSSNENHINKKSYNLPIIITILSKKIANLFQENNKFFIHYQGQILATLQSQHKQEEKIDLC